MKATQVFSQIKESFDEGYNFISLRGGTRSGKTYQVLIFLIMLAASTDQAKTIKIVRKELRTTKATVLQDFLEILKNNDLYDASMHKKSDPQEYNLCGTVFQFSGMDDASKKKGAKQDILFMNEVLDFSQEDFAQLNMRTEGLGLRIFDYNPSEVWHWFYESVESRSDCKFIHSTYLNNPFISAEQKAEIERLAEIDPFYHKVYVLGEPAHLSNTVYTKWQEIDGMPEPEVVDWHGLALDFGDVNPNALLEVMIYEDNLYLRELLYMSGLNSYQLGDQFKEIDTIKANPHIAIIADSAEPQKIKDLQDQGYNITPAKSKKVYQGIQEVKKYKINIEKSSVNLLKEIRAYKWRETKQGQVLDEPVKINDHLLDCLRYFVHEVEIVKNNFV